jgi:hypothetical protein
MGYWVGGLEPKLTPIRVPVCGALPLPFTSSSCPQCHLNLSSCPVMLLVQPIRCLLWLWDTGQVDTVGGHI